MEDEYTTHDDIENVEINCYTSELGSEMEASTHKHNLV